MLRHAYETTTLSRQYRAGPFFGVYCCCKGKQENTVQGSEKAFIFKKYDYSPAFGHRKYK